LRPCGPPPGNIIQRTTTKGSDDERRISVFGNYLPGRACGGHPRAYRPRFFGHREDILRATHAGWLAEPRWIIDGWGPWDDITARFALADLIVVPDYPLAQHRAWAVQRQAEVARGERRDWPPAGCDAAPLTEELLANIWLAILGVEEIGIDDFHANRAPDNSYRTTPLRGLFSHMKRGFYHDGRFATLLDVVNHYDSFKRLVLTEQEKKDLVEYLKSL